MTFVITVFLCLLAFAVFCLVVDIIGAAIRGD